ncbi:MAG: hypothetical protein ACREP1_08145, partial [Rhodanobacteraceae bacterium]
MREGAEQRTFAPVEVAPADDARVRRLLASLPPATRFSAPSAKRRTLGEFANASVGSIANVWVAQFAIGSSDVAYVALPATLLARTAHGNIWADAALLSGRHASAAFAGESLAVTAARIGADFENAYASDTKHFASVDYSPSAPGLQTAYRACDSNGAAIGTTAQYVTEPSDGRVNVMVVDNADLGSGVGGYFSGVNYVPQSAWNCLSSSIPRSNEAPFIYIGWNDGNGAQYELQEDLVRATAHELQHLVNFVQHSISSGAPSDEEPFLNEGLSMLAQDFAVNRMFGIGFDADDALRRSAVFLDAPSNFALSDFSGIDPLAQGGDGVTARSNCVGCYGAAYLFQRYLYDRFGSDRYTHQMESGGETGSAGLRAAT